MRRIFLVGCPRSGTTLLQSRLAAHPDVVTFPETHFFYGIRSKDGDARGTVGDEASEALARLSRLVGPVPRPSPGADRLADYAAAFVATLDAAAQARGRAAWLEKTPIHLWYVEDISRHVPAARTVHLVRGGVAVVASLVDVTSRYPDAWGGRRLPDQCLGRWRDDLRRSLACVGRPGHVFVSYERLVTQPGEVLRSLVAELGLSSGARVVDTMLTDFDRGIDDVARTEPWKDGVTGAIHDPGEEKARAVLGSRHHERVRSAVDADMPLLARIPFL